MTAFREQCLAFGQYKRKLGVAAKAGHKLPKKPSRSTYSAIFKDRDLRFKQCVFDKMQHAKNTKSAKFNA
jgi:hypothetical protein